MRDIEFRGKEKKTGKWVSGLYFIDVVEDGDRDHFIKAHYIMTPYGDHYQQIEVDPETVGQYTGLLDCKGVKIFEGDIMRAEHQGVYTGPVYYEEAQWFGARDYLQRAVDDGAVVIGNIHDHKSLLEVQQ